MTTRETINKLPENVRNKIEDFRASIKHYPRYKELYTALCNGYIEGLKDSGLITETDARVLKVYKTV